MVFARCLGISQTSIAPAGRVCARPSRKLGSRSRERLRSVVALTLGYDWATTRQAVESEAKSVRRRLQKIKQLLADGQVPDDSVEAATSNLLDSVHISLPQLPSQMAPDEMMQAVRDELGDHSDSDDDDSASWQTLPAPRSGQSSLRPSARPTTATPGSGRHAKLQRSARSLIDFNFRGLEVEFDQADPSQPSHIASRIAVAARRFEIIDNIRTSTWQTFLTRCATRIRPCTVMLRVRWSGWNC